MVSVNARNKQSAKIVQQLLAQEGAASSINLASANVEIAVSPQLAPPVNSQTGVAAPPQLVSADNSQPGIAASPQLAAASPQLATPGNPQAKPILLFSADSSISVVLQKLIGCTSDQFLTHTCKPQCMCKPQCISFLVENKIQSLVHLGSVMQQSPRDAVVTFIAREWAFTGKQANDLWECAINAADKALFGQAPSRILQRVAPTEQRTEAPHDGIAASPQLAPANNSHGGTSASPQLAAASPQLAPADNSHDGIAASPQLANKSNKNK